MNAGKHKTVLQVAMVLVLVQIASAESVRVATSKGNKLYTQGNYNEAINQYDQALVEAPQALEPKFDKANSYYRLDDLSNAMNLYREVAAESKDMKLVTRAKYNLGNTYFQKGSKQKDSNLQKAIDDMKTAISSWRGVLDIEPENKKAAKNIEVARLTIKDLLDQLKNQQQQQDPNQPQDPNQQSQQNQQQQGSQQNSKQSKDKQKQQQNTQKDPNQPQDPNQADQKKQEQKKQQDGQEEQAQEEKEKRMAPDATAQEILDKEQRQRKERQIFERTRWQKVEKDW